MSWAACDLVYRIRWFGVEFDLWLIGSVYGSENTADLLLEEIHSILEEPGEQCTVVFALIVTEPVSECVGGDCSCPPSPPHWLFL